MDAAYTTSGRNVSRTARVNSQCMPSKPIQ
jgi:hypothetical protein